MKSEISKAIEASGIMDVLVYLSDQFLDATCPHKAYEILEMRTKAMKLIIALDDLSDLDSEGDLLLDHDLVASKIRGSGGSIDKLLWVTDPD